jgi:hypothetical protein
MAVEVATQTVVCSEQFGYNCEIEEVIEIDVKHLTTIKPQKMGPIPEVNEIENYSIGPRMTRSEIRKDRLRRRSNHIDFNDPLMKDMRSEPNQRFFLM